MNRLLTTDPLPHYPHPPHELQLLSRFMEAGILGFLNRNSAQGIRTPVNNWNPESKFHEQKISGIPYLESGNHNVESTVLNCLGSIVETRVIAMFKI